MIMSIQFYDGTLHLHVVKNLLRNDPPPLKKKTQKRWRDNADKHNFKVTEKHDIDVSRIG